ncbi:hypothetical protein L2E82_33879 [Cichorium intybus]|uniref:Uncharacterized protein n=1 Tax=Cichorium intybus TaxID=13427 RepID=A0ACB9BL84_CICIN|nr:hypothetical protein L2E82_33879 [Cichorium intybus]
MHHALLILTRIDRVCAMKFKEEVHSDDGSYELVDLDDYTGEIQHLDTKADVSSNMDLSNDDSYDFLTSELSDIKEGSAPIKSFSLDSINEDSGFEDSTKPDSSESEDDDDEEEEAPVLEFSYSDDMDEKHKFKSMAYKKLKDGIRIEDVTKDHILHYLPAKSLARCQLVSKEWESWISTPIFAHYQSQHFSQTSGFFQNFKKNTHFHSLDKSSYGMPYPPLRFLPKKVFIKSSCNGLLLCQEREDKSKYYICNPVNKEWLLLPNSCYNHGKYPKFVLAFQPSSFNFQPYYQVICPFTTPNEGLILHFDIYDSNTKSWRASHEICVDLGTSDLKSDGVFVNGVVYWEVTGGKLLAFDMKNEIYGVQKLPEGGALSMVHGELCYVKGHYRHYNKMCVLDVYNGSLMSSKNTMSFCVPFDDVARGDVVGCSILGNTCDDDIVVILKKAEGRDCLFVYRVKRQKVEGPLLLDSSIKLFPYVNSLVSIAA